MAHEAPEWDAVPDALPEFSVEYTSTEFSVHFSHSLYKDLEYIMSLSGKPLEILTADFTAFALGATRLAQNPGEGLYRDAGGYEELVSLELAEYNADINWQMEEMEENEHIYIMDLTVGNEEGDTLKRVANSFQIDLDELYNRMYRMGISFFRDTEEYDAPYYLKKDGEKLQFGYAFFFPQDGDCELSL